MKQSDIRTAWQGGERCRSCAIRHLALFAKLEQQDFNRKVTAEFRRRGLLRVRDGNLADIDADGLQAIGDQ